ncbi:hypothetical protein BJY21_001401 [Kineosphaera limosa]|nr:SdpI family protein [Kineosphaera limosa]NYE00217.1 hypothetical protein [Kineosphaera limosa]
MGLVSGVSLIGVSVLLWWVTASAARGDLGRNGAVGIRTAATTASDAAWVAGHRAALPTAKITGIVGAIIGGNLVGAGLWSPSEEPSGAVLVLFAVGYSVIIVAALVAARIASQAAREAER